MTRSSKCNAAVNAARDPPIDFIWSTSEKAKLRAMSLYLIRSIVESHVGSIEVDLATDTINIDVPDEEEIACAQEIEEQVGGFI